METVIFDFLGAVGKPQIKEKQLCYSIRLSAGGLRTPTLPQGKGTPSLAGLGTA